MIMRVSLQSVQCQHLPEMLSPIEVASEVLFSYFAQSEDSIRPSTRHANTLLKHTFTNTLLMMVGYRAYSCDQYPTLRKFFKKLSFCELAEHNQLMLLNIDADYVDIQRLFQQCKLILQMDEIDVTSPEFQAIAEIDVLCETLNRDLDIAWLAEDEASSLIIAKERPSNGLFWAGAFVDVPNEVRDQRTVVDYLDRHYVSRVLSSKDQHSERVNLPDENYCLVKELVTKRACKSASPLNTLRNFDKGHDLSLALAYGQEARSILTFLSGHPEIACGIDMFWDDMLMAKHRQLPYGSAQEILDAVDRPNAGTELGEDVCSAFEGNRTDIRFNVNVSFSRVLINYLKLSKVEYDLVIENPLNLGVLEKLKENLLK